MIDDETLEHLSILAKLELTPKERAVVSRDLDKLLADIDKLNELDTEGVEPLIQVLPVPNVFREDEVTNGDGSAEALRNAPERKDARFVVPKTFE